MAIIFKKIIAPKIPFDSFRVTILTVLFFLHGCSMLPSVPIPGLDYIAGEEGLLRDRQGDYLDAEVLPPTQIPSTYDSFIIDDLMVIPEISGDADQAFLIAPRPAPFSGRAERGVVIQRMSEESWIVVDVSPSEVWPRIRDYWTRNSIEIAVENPTRGVLDTGWFILESNVLTKEKMRVSVEPGFQNDSAEIRLLHVSAAQAIPTIGQVNWPESSNDPEVEFDFLSDLSNYLADVADLYQASSVSFLAENIDSQGKASLVSTPGGKELLRLEADYERSWAAIGRALERAGVEVVAESVELGVYEVDYVINNNDDEEDEPGFFKKVVTLYGLLDRGEPQRFYPLKIQLLELNGEVEVLVESLELLPQPTGGFSEAENSLLRLIRNNIA
jgi:outer membrane protein assembly factor BamC